MVVAVLLPLAAVGPTGARAGLKAVEESQGGLHEAAFPPRRLELGGEVADHSGVGRVDLRRAGKVSEAQA